MQPFLFFLQCFLEAFFKRVGLIDEAFSAKMNKFAFAVALPALLFQDISAVDIRESWNGGFVLFCFIATFLSITGVTVLSFFVVKREERGEFVQEHIEAVRQFLELHLSRISMVHLEWHRL